METKEPQFAKVKPAQRASWLRKYPELASGPYAVLIRQQDTPINLINLADTINRYYLSVEEISKQNRHTVKVLLTDRVEANHLTQNPTFTSTYRVYVPCRNVEIDGIVDEQGLNSTDLLKNGVGKFKKTNMDSVHIIRCSQLAKYSSEQNKYLPAQGLRVTFAGTILPDFIEYKHVLIPVRLFIPKVMYCQKCHRFGHTERFCCNSTRTSSNFCISCEIVHHRFSDCPKFKIKAIKMKQQYKESCKKRYLAASNEQSHQETTTPKEQPKEDQPHSCNQHHHQQDCSSKVKSLFTLPQLVSLLCDAAGAEDNWREIINLAMPFWKHLWRFIVMKVPELDRFVTT